MTHFVLSLRAPGQGVMCGWELAHALLSIPTAHLKVAAFSDSCKTLGRLTWFWVCSECFLEFAIFSQRACVFTELQNRRKRLLRRWSTGKAGYKRERREKTWRKGACKGGRKHTHNLSSAFLSALSWQIDLLCQVSLLIASPLPRLLSIGRKGLLIGWGAGGFVSFVPSVWILLVAKAGRRGWAIRTRICMEMESQKRSYRVLLGSKRHVSLARVWGNLKKAFCRPKHNPHSLFRFVPSLVHTPVVISH